ncbi:MAG: hypothetical protein ABWW66_06605 [Archaeoglobaceae archaeon]
MIEALKGLPKNVAVDFGGRFAEELAKEFKKVYAVFRSFEDVRKELLNLKNVGVVVGSPKLRADVAVFSEWWEDIECDYVVAVNSIPPFGELIRIVAFQDYYVSVVRAKQSNPPDRVPSRLTPEFVK